MSANQSHSHYTHLEAVLGDLSISSSGGSGISLSPSNLTKSLQHSIRQGLQRTGFPTWQSLRSSSLVPGPCQFILELNDRYEIYNENAPEVGPELPFGRAASIIYELRRVFAHNSEDAELYQRYETFTAGSMGRAVFGSNMQERSGLGREDTMTLCKRIFDGEDIDPAQIEAGSEEYTRQLRFVTTDLGHQDAGKEQVIKSRREVIQHAKAFKFITDRALLHDELLTEDVIMETHRILMEGVTLENGEDIKYAGVYGKVVVWAGICAFTDPSMVLHEMQVFVKDFNDDVLEREASKKMDPFFLAANLCQDFVMIHPFRDGNGRMCRILANAYLIRYAGIFISIGEDQKDREQYLAIAAEAGEEECEELARGKLARFFLDEGDKTLGRLRSKCLGTTDGVNQT